MLVCVSCACRVCVRVRACMRERACVRACVRACTRESCCCRALRVVVERLRRRRRAQQKAHASLCQPAGASGRLCDAELRACRRDPGRGLS